MIESLNLYSLRTIDYLMPNLPKKHKNLNSDGNRRKPAIVKLTDP